MHQVIGRILVYLSVKVKLDLQEVQDLQVEVKQEIPDQVVQPVQPVRLDHLVTQAIQDILALQVRQELQVTRAIQALQVLQAIQDILALQVRQELQVTRAIQALQVLQVIQDIQVPLVRQELQVIQDILVPLVRQELQVIQDILAPLVH
jgi:hypothetical protein